MHLNCYDGRIYRRDKKIKKMNSAQNRFLKKQGEVAASDTSGGACVGLHYLRLQGRVAGSVLCPHLPDSNPGVWRAGRGPDGSAKSLIWLGLQYSPCPSLSRALYIIHYVQIHGQACIPIIVFTVKIIFCFLLFVSQHLTRTQYLVP